MNSGFIYVASRQKIYYEMGIEAAKSLKDVYPEANVTLFTHDCYVDDRAEQVFDSVITGIPIHRRAKMWCMARTPYDQTFYTDVDSFFLHPDIKHVFNDLDDDIWMTENLLHTVSSEDLRYIDKENNHLPFFHGAVAWYKKSDANLEFMQTWWSEYVKQLIEPWPYEQYSDIWKIWDMFTLWKMYSGVIPGFEKFTGRVKLGDRRFNCTLVDYEFRGTNKPTVLMQIPQTNYKYFRTWNNMKRNCIDEPAFNDKHYTSEASIEYN